MAGFLLKKQYAVITDKAFAIKLLNDPPDRYILFRKKNRSVLFFSGKVYIYPVDRYILFRKKNRSVLFFILLIVDI